MTRANTTVTLGMLGEDIIFDMFEKAQKTDDWYDSKKDGTMTDTKKTYEVKTFRLNNKYQGIFIDRPQFKKIDEVDIRFWVRVPEQEFEKVRIYEFFADKCYDFRMNGTSGRMYPIEDMKYIGEYPDLEKAQAILEKSMELSKHKRFK